MERTGFGLHDMIHWTPNTPKTYYYGPLKTFINVTSKTTRKCFYTEIYELIEDNGSGKGRKLKTAAHVLACLLLSRVTLMGAYQKLEVAEELKKLLIELFDYLQLHDITEGISEFYIMQTLEDDSLLYENRFIKIAMEAIEVIDYNVNRVIFMNVERTCWGIAYPPPSTMIKVKKIPLMKTILPIATEVP